MAPLVGIPEDRIGGVDELDGLAGWVASRVGMVSLDRAAVGTEDVGLGGLRAHV